MCSGDRLLWVALSPVESSLEMAVDVVKLIHFAPEYHGPAIVTWKMFHSKMTWVTDVHPTWVLVRPFVL